MVRDGRVHLTRPRRPCFFAFRCVQAIVAVYQWFAEPCGAVRDMSPKTKAASMNWLCHGWAWRWLPMNLFPACGRVAGTVVLAGRPTFWANVLDGRTGCWRFTCSILGETHVRIGPPPLAKPICRIPLDLLRLSGAFLGVIRLAQPAASGPRRSLAYLGGAPFVRSVVLAWNGQSLVFIRCARPWATPFGNFHHGRPKATVVGVETRLCCGVVWPMQSVALFYVGSSCWAMARRCHVSLGWNDAASAWQRAFASPTRAAGLFVGAVPGIGGHGHRGLGGAIIDRRAVQGLRHFLAGALPERRKTGAYRLLWIHWPGQQPVGRPLRSIFTGRDPRERALGIRPDQGLFGRAKFCKDTVCKKQGKNFAKGPPPPDGDFQKTFTAGAKPTGRGCAPNWPPPPRKEISPRAGLGRVSPPVLGNQNGEIKINRGQGHTVVLAAGRRGEVWGLGTG